MDNVPGASCRACELAIDNRLDLQVTKKEQKHWGSGWSLYLCKRKREVLSSETGDRWTMLWKVSNARVEVWFLS